MGDPSGTIAKAICVQWGADPKACLNEHILFNSGGR